METLARTTDPGTSRMAAGKVAALPCRQVAQVVLEVMRDAKRPVSDSQMYMGVAQRYGDRWADRTVRHGRAALARHGYIEPAEDKVLNGRGCWCKAWQLTEKGVTTQYAEETQ